MSYCLDFGLQRTHYFHFNICLYAATMLFPSIVFAGRGSARFVSGVDLFRCNERYAAAFRGQRYFIVAQ